jgi:hypothetical protein
VKTSEPLSPAARRLLELGSIVDPPSVEQCERMDRALAPLFGAGRSAPLGDSPPRSAAERSVAGTEALLGRPRHKLGVSDKLGIMSRSVQDRLALGSTKLVLAVGALAATAGASFWLGRAWTPPAEPSAMTASVGPAETDALARSRVLTTSELPAVSHAAVSHAAVSHAAVSHAAVSHAAVSRAAVSHAAVSRAAMSPASATQKTPAADDAPPLASSPPADARRQGDGAPGKPRPSSGLAAEIERMARVEAALRQGRPARALEYLGQGKAEHLVEQAEALRAVAGCQSGMKSAALGAHEVLQRWPASAFQSRIRDACGL